MFDVVALGELLIDFTPSGTNELGMLQFARNPGGAPANVLVMYNKLGGKTAFVGKVGKDSFGQFLKDTLTESGVDCTGLVMDSQFNTTLAFVHLDAHGDRTFSFYRKPGADVMLQVDELDRALIGNCRIFHFGAVSLSDEPCRSTTLAAAQMAKSCGAIISFDPNYRPLLWSSEAEAVREILRGIELADIIKVSEEELELLTGEADLLTGARLLAEHGAALVLISLGEHGAFYYTAQHHARIATYSVKTIDTTGAGDTFLGAVLYRLKDKSKQEIADLDEAELADIVLFANAAGSLTTTKKGAIPAMPTCEQIAACQKQTPRLD